MAIIKKTLQNLKPGKQYLLTVSTKDADLNNTLDPSTAIRFTVPTDQVEPTSLGNLQISVGYKTAMVSFNPADDLNLKNYEYKVYKESQVEQIGLHYEPISEDDYEIQGFSSSNVFTVNLQETSYIEQGTFVENVTDSTITTNFEQVKVYYFVKVRSITTSGVASSWTPLQKSGQIPFIPSAHIQELSASRITSGYVGSAQIILTGSDSVIKSASYKPEVGSLRATLVAGTTTVTLTQGTTALLYPGMFFFIPGLNATPPNTNPGRFGTSSQIQSITDSTHFTTTVNHSVSGLAEFTCYAKGWNITGDGRVNFGGIQGITFDGSQVRIGADAIIDPGASLPEANLFSVVSGAQSLVIGNTAGIIGLKISDTATGNISNNYWYVNGSFKVGNATKNISFNADTGAFNISGDVTIGSTTASTVVGNAATGAGDPATRINAGTTTITGGKIRTGTIESTGFSWNNSDTYSATGTKIDLDNGQIVSKNFRIDGSGNASFNGNITATGGTITGQLLAGGVQIGNNLNGAANYNGINISNRKGTWTNAWLERSDGTVYFRATSDKSYIYMDESNGTISLGNGAFSVDNDGNLTAQKGTFKGALDGASGSVTTGFVIGASCSIGDKLRINEPQSNDNAVVKIRGYGVTSGSQALVIEDSTTANTFVVRDNGAVEVKTSLTVGGTAVSLSGHAHATLYAPITHNHSYLPTTGGTIGGSLTISGSLTVEDNFRLNQVASGTGISQTTQGTVAVLCLTSTTGLPNADSFVYWKSGTGSSIRFKENIEPIADTVVNLQNFWNLQPVLFEYNTNYGGNIKEQRPYGFRKHYGFIAEEVEELAPYLVSYGDDSLTDDVKYNSVFTVLYSEVKKMRQWLIDNHDYPG